MIYLNHLSDVVLDPGVVLELDQGQLTDLPAIIALKDACIAAMQQAGIDQWDEIYPTEDVFRSSCNEACLHILKYGGKLIGCATLDEHQSPEYESVGWQFHAARVAVIHRLMISPAHQGRGYARAIMQGLEAMAAFKRYEVIRLDAFLHNPSAMKLYAGLGYRRAGEVRFRKGAFACFEKRLGGIK